MIDVEQRPLCALEKNRGLAAPRPIELKADVFDNLLPPWIGDDTDHLHAWKRVAPDSHTPPDRIVVRPRQPGKGLVHDHHAPRRVLVGYVEIAAAQKLHPHRPQIAGRNTIEVRATIANARQRIAPGHAYRRAPRSPEGQRRRQRGALHAAVRGDRALEPSIERVDLGPRVARAAQIELGREDATRFHADRQRFHVTQAPHEQAGADEHNDR